MKTCRIILSNNSKNNIILVHTKLNIVHGFPFLGFIRVILKVLTTVELYTIEQTFDKTRFHFIDSTYT